MKIQKRHLFIIFCIFFLSIGIQTFQYLKTFKEEIVSAVTIGTPNPGHALSDLECNADSLCIDATNDYVGIGTNTPTTKLDVNGVINVNSNKITNVAVPTVSTDVATKAYVDAASVSSLYDSCYVIVSPTAGLNCDAAYTTLLSNSTSGYWNGYGPFAFPGISSLTFGLGPANVTYSAGYWYNCIDSNGAGNFGQYPTSTCNMSPSQCYPRISVNGQTMSNCVGYPTAQTLKLCCK
jgi:hypothetical protein